jgi:competence protein ComEA
MKSLFMKLSIMAIVMSLLAVGPIFAEQMTSLVNVNTADQATLVTLERIGESRAQAIIQYRQEHGPFKTVEQLKDVPGIGDKVLDAIKAKITVGEG